MSRPTEIKRQAEIRSLAKLKVYSQAKADFICEHIEAGESLKSICDKYSHQLPDDSAVHKWRKKHPEFHKQYYQALETFFFKKLDEIEDLSKSDLPEGLDKVSLNAELNRRRLRIDTLKFTLAKIAPRLSEAFKEQQTQVNVGVALPSIQIVNYGQAKPQPSTLISVDSKTSYGVTNDTEINSGKTS